MKKNQTDTLPDKIKEDIDFNYIEKLGEQEQRAATFYEYARHCTPLKAFVEELRRARSFSKDRKTSPDLAKRLASKSHILRPEQLLGLVISDGFPDKPFIFTQTGRGLFDSKSNYYGVDVLTCIPWRAVSLKRDPSRNNAVDLTGWYGAKTLHAIAIPWKYTNRELSTMFSDLLSRLRPGDFPEPKKAGRQGRSTKVGVRDKINQLIAYRLDKAGYDRTASGDKYPNDKGWKNAVDTANERIRGMMEEPFFGKPKSV